MLECKNIHIKWKIVEIVLFIVILLTQYLICLINLKVSINTHHLLWALYEKENARVEYYWINPLSEKSVNHQKWSMSRHTCNFCLILNKSEIIPIPFVIATSVAQTLFSYIYIHLY